MTAAYFEDHPTDPEKVILRKPPLDQGADYERGFVDGMQYQMQSSVDKAVNRMAQTQEPVAWSLAEKVRQDLDRQSCPDAFMRIAVESIVKHHPTTAHMGRAD